MSSVKTPPPKKTVISIKKIMNNEYKMYSNELPTVLEKSKRDHYSNYFKKNIYISDISQQNSFRNRKKMSLKTMEN